MYSERPKRVAVLGAGIVGLSTAYRLSEHIERSGSNVEITVIADKFTTDTTSFGAAGIFRMNTSWVNAKSNDELKEYSADSWKWFESVGRSMESNNAGISMLAGHQFFYEPPRMDELIFKDLVYNFQVCEPEKMTFMPNCEEFSTALSFTTFVVESRRLLPWLTTRLLNRGAKFEKRFLSSLDEISDKYDCLVNCTGLGSYKLVNDTEMFPVRGHLIKVKAPWVRNFLFIGNDTYIIPGIDHVSLGGTRQKGDSNTEMYPSDIEDIRRRCSRAIPSLSTAPVDFNWVGLRPHRTTIRVTLESVRSPSGREIPLVYNIGHGAGGISLSMGTAVKAARYAFDTIGSDIAKL